MFGVGYQPFAAMASRSRSAKRSQPDGQCMPQGRASSPRPSSGSHDVVMHTTAHMTGAGETRAVQELRMASDEQLRSLDLLQPKAPGVALLRDRTHELHVHEVVRDPALTAENARLQAQLRELENHYCHMTSEQRGYGQMELAEQRERFETVARSVVEAGTRMVAEQRQAEQAMLATEQRQHEEARERFQRSEENAERCAQTEMFISEAKAQTYVHSIESRAMERIVQLEKTAREEQTASAERFRVFEQSLENQHSTEQTSQSNQISELQEMMFQLQGQLADQTVESQRRLEEVQGMMAGITIGPVAADENPSQPAAASFPAHFSAQLPDASASQQQARSTDADVDVQLSPTRLSPGGVYDARAGTPANASGQPAQLEGMPNAGGKGTWGRSPQVHFLASGDSIPSQDEAYRPSNAKEAESLKLPSLPSVSTFKIWRSQIRELVAAASCDPQRAFRWIMRCEEAGISTYKLADSESFDTLDAKLCAGLSGLIKGDLARQVHAEKESLASQGFYMRGRQLLLVIYQHYSISEAEGYVVEFRDLMAVTVQGGDLKSFLTEWDVIMAGIRKVPDEDILESMFRKQVEKHPLLREDMAYYNRKSLHDPERTYLTLHGYVRRAVESQRRQQMRDELHRSSYGKGAAASSGTTKKGVCWTFQSTGNCARGSACPFRHDDQSRGRSPGHGKGRKQKGQPSWSRSKDSGSRGRNRDRGRPQSDGSDRNRNKGKQDLEKAANVCHRYIRGQCTRGKSCKYAHPPDCRFFAKGNCKFGKKCSFRHLTTKDSSSSGSSSPAGASVKKKKKDKKRSKDTDDDADPSVATVAVTRGHLRRMDEDTSRGWATTASCDTDRIRGVRFNLVPNVSLIKVFKHMKKIDKRRIKRQDFVSFPTKDTMRRDQLDAKQRARYLSKEVGTFVCGLRKNP